MVKKKAPSKKSRVLTAAVVPRVRKRSVLADAKDHEDEIADQIAENHAG